MLAERMLASGKVEFFANCEYVGDRTFVSRISGERFEVPERCRIVDARYLAPDIPAETPPPFGVADGARVIPVNDLAGSEEAPSQYVVVGSGKTATDACIWLLARGVDPDAICWVRPRDPWMLNRAVVQPDPAIFLGMVADTMQAAAAAARRWRTCSSGSRTPASCCASTARSRRRWPRRPPWPCGSSTSCAPSRTSSGAGTSSASSRAADLRRGIGRDRGRRARRALCGGRPEVPAAGPDLGAGGDHAAADPGRASRASGPRWPATSRRRATTTPRRTGCARRRRTATRWPTGRG